jgi:hypothetical protein
LTVFVCAHGLLRQNFILLLYSAVLVIKYHGRMRSKQE